MKIGFAKKEIAPLFIILLMVIIAFGLYQAPCTPDKLPTHWNQQGEIDAYSSKNFALFFFPVLTLAMYLLMTFLPFIDPLRKNYQQFSLAYFLIRFVLVLFFAFLYFYTLWAGIYGAPKINYLIIPLISLLLITLGFLMPKIKKNYFVGIRTPWTLQSEDVWQKTHQFASKTFILTGILSFLTIFTKESAFGFFLAIILVGAFVPVVYSYFIFKKLKLFNK
ncbi:SdpI family protein [Candidatus Gribaldobacteria bacterium]|nr:SdpI family protein [Candidatus Gribaldobacteria bacterium]